MTDAKQHQQPEREFHEVACVPQPEHRSALVRICTQGNGQEGRELAGEGDERCVRRHGWGHAECRGPTWNLVVRDHDVVAIGASPALAPGLELYVWVRCTARHSGTSAHRTRFL